MKLEINHRKRNEKNNYVEMKHMLLKNPKGQQRNLKIPWNKWQWKHTIIQTLWDAAKAVIRGKFIVISAFLKKQEKSQINNQTYHLKELEKEEQTKPKVSRMKEIIKLERK